MNRAASIDATGLKGLGLADKALRSELIRRFLNALHRMKLAGYIEKVGKGPGGGMEVGGVGPPWPGWR